MQSQQAGLFDDLYADDTLVQARYLIGVDEVGRGPLIGDVVAAAVILADDCSLPLADSKKLSESKRNALSEQIQEQAVAYAIAVATPQEIDTHNILKATFLAMQRAVAQVMQQVGGDVQILVDGNRCPPGVQPCQAIVKGDAKIPAISAASILAKVYRDRQMLELHERFPQYGFAQHKGYPTVSHLQAISQHGLIEGYRHSFKPIKVHLQEANL